jgi:ubiquinone/menaquinone biosynthesis C-methylase UbiE
MFSWLFAKIYDRMMLDAEEKCLNEWRADLLRDLKGNVLELGCGTGANLGYYPTDVKHLALAEPNEHMVHELHKKLIQFPKLKTDVLNYDGNKIPLAEKSIDAVVLTLVLCSVENPQNMLSEIHRVLKPQGKLYFIEHVAAFDNPVRLKWQKRFEPLWKVLACGCHLTRSTEATIENSGFKIEKILRESLRGVPKLVRPSIRGVALANH